MEGKASSPGPHQLNFPSLTSGKAVNFHLVLPTFYFLGCVGASLYHLPTLCSAPSQPWREYLTLWKLVSTTNQSFIFVSGEPLVKHLQVHHACNWKFLQERGGSELRGGMMSAGREGWWRSEGRSRLPGWVLSSSQTHTLSLTQALDSIFISSSRRTCCVSTHRQMLFSVDWSGEVFYLPTEHFFEVYDIEYNNLGTERFSYYGLKVFSCRFNPLFLF